MNSNQQVLSPTAFLRIDYLKAAENCQVNAPCDGETGCQGRDYCSPGEFQISHELFFSSPGRCSILTEDEIMAFSAIAILRRVLTSISPISAIKVSEWLLGWLTGADQVPSRRKSLRAGLSGWLVSIFETEELMFQGISPIFFGKPLWVLASEDEHLEFCKRYLDYLEETLESDDEVQRLECGVLWLVHCYLTDAVIGSVREDNLDLAGLGLAIPLKMDRFAAKFPFDWMGEQMRLDQEGFDQNVENTYISLEIVKSLLFRKKRLPQI